MKIILGSSSAGRRLVMQSIGHDFEVMIPDIDEKATRKDLPEDLVMAIAEAKAEALIPKIKEPALLVTSDQVVLYQGKVREKPIDKIEAKKFLASYAKAPAETLGAIVVVNTETGKKASGLQRSKVFFKPMSAIFIDNYIETGGALRGAGGFVISDKILESYIDRIEGTMDSASGLSVDLLNRLMAEVK